MFCQKPPKGFEKYFRQGGAKPVENNKDAKLSEKPKSSVSSESKSDWNFGMFSSGQSKKGGRSGQGRPIGGEGGDREKWLLFGALGTAVVVGSIAYFGVGYKEIAWKEFVNK